MFSLHFFRMWHNAFGSVTVEMILGDIAHLRGSYSSVKAILSLCVLGALCGKFCLLSAHFRYPGQDGFSRNSNIP